jgi:hypothetical protein
MTLTVFYQWYISQRNDELPCTVEQACYPVDRPGLACCAADTDAYQRPSAGDCDLFYTPAWIGAVQANDVGYGSGCVYRWIVEMPPDASTLFLLAFKNVSFLLTQGQVLMPPATLLALWALLVWSIAGFLHLTLNGPAPGPDYLHLIIPLSLAVVVFLADGAPGFWGVMRSESNVERASSAMDDAASDGSGAAQLTRPLLLVSVSASLPLCWH